MSMSTTPLPSDGRPEAWNLGHITVVPTPKGAISYEVQSPTGELKHLQVQTTCKLTPVLLQAGRWWDSSPVITD